MAEITEIEAALRHVLNEGTAYGQTSWAGTSKATLATAQHVANLLNQQVIPALKALAARNGGAAAPLAGLEAGQAETEGDHARQLATDPNSTNGQEQDYAADAGVQQIDQATGDDARLSIEAGLLVETDNGPHGDDEDVSQDPEVQL